MENINFEHSNNKFKISAPTWNYEFDLPNASYSISDIQCCLEYFTEKHETIADNPPVSKKKSGLITK